jgi:putative hydrolase of the HAD superfamily
MLERMKLRKIVFTNADAQHARRVLSLLGIMRRFEFIIDIHMLDFVNKPDRRAYVKALEFASARAEECILIEDSMANIIPAVKLGMTTVLVGQGPESDGAHHHIQHITDLGKVISNI